jgi:hypothetical protein
MALEDVGVPPEIISIIAEASDRDPYVRNAVETWREATITIPHVLAHMVAMLEQAKWEVEQHAIQVLERSVGPMITPSGGENG